MNQPVAAPPAAVTSSDPVVLERQGHLLVIRLNRPEARNALDVATARGLHAAMDLLDEDADLYAAVITGCGGNFCAGADLKAASRGERPWTERGFAGMVAKPAKKPLIAAVEGWALGGGFELCLSCDLVVAARDARFGLPEVKRNLVAIGGGLLRLPKRIPHGLAVEMALTGEPRTAEALAPHGIINRITEPGEALAGALELAGKVLVNGPTALAASVQILRQTHSWSEDEAWDRQSEIAAVARDSQDAKEGVRAFIEKRAPVWTGR